MTIHFGVVRKRLTFAAADAPTAIMFNSDALGGAPLSVTLGAAGVMQGRRFCLFILIMNTTTSAVNGPRWKTYIAGAIFSIPALFFWGVACVVILPKVKAVLTSGGHDASDLGWLWRNPLFLVAYGRFILIPILITLAALELFSRQWPRYRRAGVGLLAWLLNVAVLYGLTLLLLCVLLSASGLSGR